MLDALRHTWKRTPDLRLGQLLLNPAVTRDERAFAAVDDAALRARLMGG